MLRPSGLWLLLRRTVVECYQDRVLGLAAEAGFWALVSLPPLLLVVVGTIGYVAQLLKLSTVDSIQDSVLSNAGRFLSPTAVHQVVEPVVTQVLHGGRADLISIGFVLSLWAGSTAMSAYVNTITIAYDMRNIRGAIRSRALAFLLYLGAVVVGIVLLPALLAGPRLAELLSPGGSHHLAVAAAKAAYWPLVVLISVALIATLYHLSVPVRTQWRRDLPGALLAMGLWVVSSIALRIYFASVLRGSPTYGAIASPIAVLLWLYFTALAVLIGAELNAEIDKLWPAKTTERARARLGQAAEQRKHAREDTDRAQVALTEQVDSIERAGAIEQDATEQDTVTERVNSTERLDLDRSEPAQVERTEQIDEERTGAR